MAGNFQAAQTLLSRFSEVGTEQSLASGAVLFHQGDSAREVFSVVEGRLRLDRYLKDGRVVTVAVVTGAGLLAEAALFSERYRCSATAETRCKLFRVPKAEVQRILENEPGVAFSLIRGLVSEVRDLRTRLELRNVRPASERLLQYLRLQGERAGEPEERPLSALAIELGLSAEALYRVVARLEAEGRVKRDGRRLRLLS